MADLLTLYGVADAEERAALLNLAREVISPGWWHAYSDVLSAWLEPYVGLEAAASVIRTYQIQFVPGLLQTEAYARALIRHGGRPAMRRSRGRASCGPTARRSCARPDAPQLWVVVDEGALRRPVGSREIVREQLKYLIEMAEHPGGDAADPAVPPPGRTQPWAEPSPSSRFAEPDIAERGSHRAADQSAVPGQAGRGGQLPGDHEPAVPAGRIGREHRQAAPAGPVRHRRA